jgi:hypothetical protein
MGDKSDITLPTLIIPRMRGPAFPDREDEERTAVVPLAELARRAEERLRERPDPADRAPGAALPSAPARAVPLGEIIDVLRAAGSVEEVAGVLVEMVANLVPRVLLLWERNATLHGFASRGMGLSEVKLLTLELPRAVLQELTGRALDLESYQGPPCPGERVRRLFEILGGAPPEILVVPVFVTPRDRWVLYADHRDRRLPELELRLIEVICARAGARADVLMDPGCWSEVTA